MKLLRRLLLKLIGRARAVRWALSTPTAWRKQSDTAADMLAAEFAGDAEMQDAAERLRARWRIDPHLRNLHVAYIAAAFARAAASAQEGDMGRAADAVAALRAELIAGTLPEPGAGRH